MNTIPPKIKENLRTDLTLELDKFLLKMPLRKKLLIALQHGFEIAGRFDEMEIWRGILSKDNAHI